MYVVCIGKAFISAELGAYLLNQKENRSLDRVIENFKAGIVKQIATSLKSSTDIAVDLDRPKLGWLWGAHLNTLKVS